jgi:hypothetical protein
MSKLYTARGKVLAGEVERLTLFDGKFNTAYRIIDFHIAPQNVSATETVQMKISTKDVIHNTGWFWAKNSEIGWASYKGATSLDSYYAKWDKDALIIEDLFLDATADSGEFVNYMLTLEKVSTTDWMGALAMVRNSSQDID